MGAFPPVGEGGALLQVFPVKLKFNSSTTEMWQFVSVRFLEHLHLRTGYYQN